MKSRDAVMLSTRKTCIITNIQNNGQTQILILRPIYEIGGTYSVEIPSVKKDISDDCVYAIGDKYYKGDIVQYDKDAHQIIEDIYYETKHTIYDVMTVTGAAVITSNDRIGNIISSEARRMKEINLFGKKLGRKTIYVEKGSRFYDTERFDEVLVERNDVADSTAMVRNFTLEEKLKHLFQSSSPVKIIAYNSRNK